jgi:Carboxypeptidase regulatory-like domain
VLEARATVIDEIVDLHDRIGSASFRHRHFPGTWHPPRLWRIVKSMRYPVLILYSILTFPLAALAAEQPCDKTTPYEDHNQVDYGPLQVQRISGTVIDPGGVVIPGACILAFSESDHRFIAAVKSGKGGQFALSDISPGAYRLVSRYDGFSVANARVEVGRFSGRRTIVVKMRPAGLDAGSYIEMR